MATVTKKHIMSNATLRDRHANGGHPAEKERRKMEEGLKPRDRHKDNYGMNFVRRDLRIALYLRDGLACVYCGAGIEDGAKLTLDHLAPHSDGGSNAATNLVTACHKCNSSRGNRDYHTFAMQVATYLNHGITGGQIILHIETTVQRPVDRQAAKTILAARGGFMAAMQSLK